MTCDGRARACQDVKVTNDDDEEEESWSDDDEAQSPRLEAIRICGGPLLGFFGHESYFTHPVQHSSTPPSRQCGILLRHFIVGEITVLH